MTLPTSCIVGVFAKQPKPGQVKTRLAQSIGENDACDLYMACVGDTLEVVENCDVPPVICYTPAMTEAKQSLWNCVPTPELWAWWPQPEGDLGQRMGQFFEEHLIRQPSKVILIGTDAPHLSSQVIVEAFELLEHDDAVLGPCEDGGYYLIGFSKYRPGLLEGIAWSTQQTCEQTIQAFERHGLSHALLAENFDIDTIDELDRLVEILNSQPEPAKMCQRTWARLKKLGFLNETKVNDSLD